MTGTLPAVGKQKRRDDKVAMQTGIDVLTDNQRINGRR